jgi:paraquat-inducible protein B
MYIALDFFPNAIKASVNWTASIPEIPTTPGAMQGLQSAIASVAAKIDRFPLDKLGKDASSALVSADRLLKSVNTDVAPDLRQTLQTGTKLLQRLDTEVTPEARDAIIEARKTLVSADRFLASDAPIQSDTREAMRQIARAAHAFRTLADYIERHPESVVMGKKED